MPRRSARHTPQLEAQDGPGEPGMQTFWQWFAVGVLLFCWIAEATLCAQRGF
jgi:hypothetical protein